jgi:hypothetical protein
MRPAAVAAIACLWAAAAGAQPVGDMEQATRGAPSGPGITQIKPPAAQDRASVTQLPPGLRDRGAPAAQTPRIADPPGAARDELALGPALPNPNAVDADEIARILASGEVTRIDAAAAIADSRNKQAAEADAFEARLQERLAQAKAAGK